MVTKKNLMEIVQKLLVNVNESQMGNKYRDEIIAKLIDICSQNDYQFIANFEWYITVLVELSRVEGGTEHGGLIAQQLLDVAIRVEAIRSFVTRHMAILLENSHLFLNNSSVCEVLYAAAWICGEFADFIPNQMQTLLHLLTTTAFPAHITAFDDNDSEDETIEEMHFGAEEEEEEEEIILSEEQIQHNRRMADERKAQNDKNPNYLKSSSKSKKKRKSKKERDIEMADEVVEEAQEVVPNIVTPVISNAIPGLISSQNYVKKTKPKKTKKSKKKQMEEEEDEEETEVHQIVTIKGLEMPEGVDANDLESDEDSAEGQTQDPHKALAKITFSESDFVSNKYVSKHSKDLNATEDKPKKKKKSSKKVTQNEEKIEKKVKKKRVKPKENEDLLLENGDNLLVNVESVETSAHNTTSKKKSKRPKTLELNGEKKKSKKKSKSKTSTVLETTELIELERKRDEYEETAGIETPSLFVPSVQSSIPSETPVEPAVEPSTPENTI
ncbi:unnamed protein product [Oppiella nova]|uniref:AP-3 complex subunit delta domain-containing protein n=1 Tax=Oppiella nova TaxID=334625 RepID=A0A7R9LR23_9ACAR|nr:unnamed protein product [Oppiella nova]CAG2166121.1 unnamed protein product [Oppiella nova]